LPIVFEKDIECVGPNFVYVYAKHVFYQYVNTTVLLLKTFIRSQICIS